MENVDFVSGIGTVPLPVYGFLICQRQTKDRGCVLLLSLYMQRSVQRASLLAEFRMLFPVEMQEIEAVITLHSTW